MENGLPVELNGKQIYMVGIKGTGMAALAEILTARGAVVRGSDVEDRFFTDEILLSLGLKVFHGFSENNLQGPIDVVIYSAAYNPSSHPELIKAQSLGYPLLVYTEALGQYSKNFYSAGISGVHGKTTTTALAGVLVKAMGLQASVLAGSLVPDFGNRATITSSGEYFIAETCEYKRHFLSFYPSALLVTSIELDHTDYFHDYNDIFKAFVEYSHRLPMGGVLITCADEPGATQLAEEMKKLRPDLQCITYGKNASGPFKIINESITSGLQSFELAGWSQRFYLTIPGAHNRLNAAGALALIATLCQHKSIQITNQILEAAAEALRSFKGSRRRAQIIGERDGILIMDDYGHHPTAIETTLKGLKEFFPDRRLVVDFMSHTYSRTKSLLKEFAASFSSADEVVLHKIYASAREAFDPETTGEILANETRKYHPNVKYFEEIMDALPYYQSTLKSGDLLVTMGAGDNWKVGEAFYMNSQGDLSDE